MVTDAHQVGGLGVVRGLGRAGYEVIAAAPARGLKLGGCRSRHAGRVLSSPSPWASFVEYTDWLRDTLQRNPVDLVLPTDTASMLAANEVRAESAAPASRFAMAEKKALLQSLEFEPLADKLANTRLEPLAIRMISDGDTLNTAELSAGEFPLAAYRPLAVSRRGRLINARKTVVRSAAELAALADQSASEGAMLFAAPLVSGGLITIVSARWQRQTLGSVAQRSIHTLDETRAWSSLRAVDTRHFVRETAEQITAHLDLDGLSVIQLRESAAGELFLESVTPGCPVSSSLALQSGVNLPGLLANAMLDRPPAGLRQRRLRPGRRCGNFYPGECRYLITAMQDAPAAVPELLRRALAVTLNQLNPRVGRDYLSLTDPMPGLAQLRPLLRTLRGMLSRSVYALLRRSAPRLKDASEVRENPPGSLLFLCKGNTCRSYFAAERLRARLAERGVHGIAIQSAGVTAETGQRPPERFTRLLERCGLDPAAHRSVPLKSLDAGAFDLILLMDRQQLDHLGRHRPELLERAVMFGELDREHPGDVGDPISASPLEAENVFRRIDRLVAELAVLMHSRQPSSDRPQGPSS